MYFLSKKNYVSPMKMTFLSPILLLSFLSYSQNYTIGEKWDKKFIFEMPDKIQSLAPSIGEVGSSATMFYIGDFKNKHYVLTNSHVCPSKEKCFKRNILFFYHKNKKGEPLKGFIKDVPLINPNLDFALVEVSFINASSFESPPKPFKLSNKLPVHNTPLINIGYGVYNNEYGSLMAEASGDCKVYSKTKDIRKVKDPDTINPFPFSVYSFLIGCDVSHGDSGSPIIDFKSGQVLGILWTGKMPKDPKVRQKDLSKLPYSFLWKELNYAVPSFYIYKELKSFFNNGQIKYQI